MSGRLLLITGGARSGKSRYALARAEAAGPRVLFVATGVVTDEEMRARIARHRAERPAGWTTLELRHGVAPAVRAAAPRHTLVLLEDLASLVSNLLIERSADEQLVSAETDELVALAREGRPVIVVTNEVGLGVVPPSELGRRFRDLLGLANQRVAAAADEVVLLVSGLPLSLKGPPAGGT